MTASSSGALCSSESRVEVGQDVSKSLEPDAQPDQVGRYASADLLLFGQLGVCRRCRVDCQTTDVSDIREMAEKLEAFDEATSGLLATLDAESEDGAAASGKVARLACMPGAGGESGVTHPRDLVACFEPFGHGKGVGDVPLHPDTEGLEALEEEE